MSKMSRGQRALARVKGFMSQNCVHWKQDVGYIEEELKDYHEIKEIAKRYHFDDLARDTHMTTTDEKYLRLFNAAIPSIQADYRKARAFDIIKREPSAAEAVQLFEDYGEYEDFLKDGESYLNKKFVLTPHLSREEFYLLKEALK